MANFSIDAAELFDIDVDDESHKHPTDDEQSCSTVHNDDEDAQPRARFENRLSSMASMACSVPVSIPVGFANRDVVSDLLDTEGFVPPHQLSLRNPGLLLEGSVPDLGTSSRIRTRNRVLRSTGFLPANTAEGFLISRVATVPSVSGAISAAGGPMSQSGAAAGGGHSGPLAGNSGPLSSPSGMGFPDNDARRRATVSEFPAGLLQGQLPCDVPTPMGALTASIKVPIGRSVSTPGGGQGYSQTPYGLSPVVEKALS